MKIWRGIFKSKEHSDHISGTLRIAYDEISLQGNLEIIFIGTYMNGQSHVIQINFTDFINKGEFYINSFVVKFVITSFKDKEISGAFSMDIFNGGEFKLLL